MAMPLKFTRRRTNRFISMQCIAIRMNGVKSQCNNRVKESMHRWMKSSGKQNSANNEREWMMIGSVISWRPSTIHSPLSSIIERHNRTCTLTHTHSLAHHCALNCIALHCNAEESYFEWNVQLSAIDSQLLTCRIYRLHRYDVYSIYTFWYQFIIHYFATPIRNVCRSTAMSGNQNRSFIWYTYSLIAQPKISENTSIT